MFGIGSTELAIILVFGFLLFGPDKLPQMGRTIGRALRQFRETQEKLTNVVQTEVVDPMTAAATAPTKSHTSSVDDDEDADVESAEGEAAPRKETFAERRARLAAEKAAAEAEAAGDTAEAEGEVSSESATAESDAVTAEPEAAPSEEDEAAAEVQATADLYARRPRKRKASAEAEEAPAAETEAAEAEAAEAPAAEATPEVEAESAVEPASAPVESAEGGEQ